MFQSFFYVSDCESQVKDHGNEQNTQDSKDTHDGCQRSLQESLDKQHRASTPGIFSLNILHIIRDC